MASLVSEFINTQDVIVLGTLLDGYIDFDAVETVSYKKSKQLTENPVESGAVVSDHSVKRPETITLVGSVSNTPINVINPLPGLTRAEDAETLLRYFHDEDITVSLYGTRREYDNMQVIDLDVQDNASTARGLFVTITLQEIRVANTEEVPIAVEASAQQTKKPVKKAAPKAKVKAKESMLSSMGSWFGV